MVFLFRVTSVLYYVFACLCMCVWIFYVIACVYLCVIVCVGVCLCVCGAGESERDADLQAAILSLAVTALQCVLFSVCAASPLLPLQYLTFILQVLNRSFLYGGNAAFISVCVCVCVCGGVS